ncbi:hypothetical protein V6N13_149639 [Hibiscus sabdariffa]|uniref:Cytochrome P450 n=2 Tax=Hibiscus sabdariffa TaxID=183260 RepID=A0ABR2EGS3_9ROSI
MEFSIQFQEHLLALVFTILVATTLVKGKKDQQRRPPEPAGVIPLLGHLRRLGKIKLLHRTLADMADKYGPAFSIRLGVHRALDVSNWEVAKECFTTNDKVFLNRPNSLAIKHMGHHFKYYTTLTIASPLPAILTERDDELAKPVANNHLICRRSGFLVLRKARILIYKIWAVGRISPCIANRRTTTLASNVSLTDSSWRKCQF